MQQSIQPPTKAKAGDAGRTTLLVITDEIDSATRRQPDIIRQRTAKHFARFANLLFSPLCSSERTILVKNVGDSLMIRVDIEKSHDGVAKLLKSILAIQSDLASDNSTGTPLEIRALVAQCDDTQVIDGERIKAPLDVELAQINPKLIAAPPSHKFPGVRSNGQCWLWGDLFGPDVARAFRASGIPKKRDLVVEDSVAKLISPGLDDGGDIGEGLLFGPRVVFCFR